MQGIDNPINAIDDVVALLLEPCDLGARSLEVGQQRIALPLQITQLVARAGCVRPVGTPSVVACGNHFMPLRGPLGLSRRPLCHSAIL
jgi:hypothetical protein